MEATSIYKPPEYQVRAIGAINDNNRKLYALFRDAAARTIWYGMVLDGMKERGKRDKSIPHGQFKHWCAAFINGENNQAWIDQALTIGRHLIEKTKFKLTDKVHDKMIDNPGYLPEPIQDVIDGKTRSILLLEAKECRERGDSEGVLVGRRGRRRGEGGNSREHLAEIREQKEKARIDAMELASEKWADWVAENCNLKSFPLMSDAAWRKHFEAAQAHWAFCRGIGVNRKGCLSE